MAEMKKNGSEDEFSVDEPDEEVGSDSDGSWNEDDEKSPAKAGGRGAAKSGGRAPARSRGGAAGRGGRGRGGRGRGSDSGTKRPSKGAAGGKAKRSKTEDDDEDDDEENEEEGENDELDEEEIEDEEEEEDEESESSGGEDDGKDPSKKEFKSGKFVVLKKDLTSGDMPPIWKIDGKVLLQKFMPFDKEGKTLYRSTSTYSGWSHHNREQYRPAPVKLEDEGPNETIVEFLRESMEAEEPAPATATSGEATGVEAAAE